MPDLKKVHFVRQITLGLNHSCLKIADKKMTAFTIDMSLTSPIKQRSQTKKCDRRRRPEAEQALRDTSLATAGGGLMNRRGDHKIPPPFFWGGDHKIPPPGHFCGVYGYSGPKQHRGGGSQNPLNVGGGVTI